jgi:hypothetical protein
MAPVDDRERLQIYSEAQWPRMAVIAMPTKSSASRRRANGL